jgi:phenylalanyl-tRNA synthetase beta chain
MKVSLKWLSEYVEIPTDLKAFCDRLDLTGTGVEGIEVSGATYDKVVVGQIVEKKAHPDSDHMWVCQVSVGEHNLDKDGAPEPLQIVCGAQNFNENDKIPVAMVGAEFGDFKIKKSKLRGVVSNGMNCSERELGLGSDHDGIMILSEDAPVGMAFADYMQLSDKILDLEITPNRPDCLSMKGMAREVAAMYEKEFTDPLEDPIFNLGENQDLEPIATSVEVTISDPARCDRYTARVIENVKVGPSPDWLAERVTASGARSINNIVDATNYILFLLGQPLHAFDYDKLAKDGKAHIIVRPAEEGEKLTTLDGEERTLTPDMSVIATPEGPVALAGVMGGLDSEVTEETTTILLEAATFDRAHTSRTSRNLGLISESSLRYERGVDDNPIGAFSDAAAALIAEISGGTVRPGIVDVWEQKTEPIMLDFRIPRFNAMMGSNIDRSYIVSTLTRLGCAVSVADVSTSEAAGCREGELLHVLAPTFRPDLEREIDLYEEVLRLYGMDRIEPTLPSGAGRIGKRSLAEQKIEKINDTLRASGLNETVTYSFAEPSDLDKLRMNKDELGMPVELLNPLNAEQSIMRQSIIPGLLHSLAYNQSHGVKNVQLYETGRVFFASEGKKKPKEKERVAAVLAGAMSDPAWNDVPVPFDFFDGKGIVENLLRELATPKVRFKALAAEEAPHLQPGRAAQVFSGGTVLGWIGEIHPLAARAFEASAPVVAFELDLDALLKTSKPSRDYVDIPLFPAVTMDIALVVDESVTNEKLTQVMTSAGGKLLSSIHLFDVYRDADRLGAGKKSMAYALEYRSADKTLTTEEANKQHERLIKKVCGATGAEVRS